MNKTHLTVRSRHLGFTLVELLVAMTVIAILIGMLAAGVLPAMTRAKEFKIQNEMKQIEQAIESFKTQHGFYPPSFLRITSANDLLPFINRISPNHGESQIITGTTRRIDAWWTEVGSHIDYSHGDDLVFWLSALCKNKQFPLTNGNAAGSMPFAYDSTPAIERDRFFEFNQDQLHIHIVGDPVANYNQPSGPEVPFIYLDHGSYVSTGQAGAYFVPPYPTPASSATNNDYLNPKTFQLVTYGIDGEPGVPGDITLAGAQGQDNIVNFADGRLDKWLIEHTD